VRAGIITCTGFVGSVKNEKKTYVVAWCVLYEPSTLAADRPREGEHFEAGVLHTEGRALGEHWAPYYVVVGLALFSTLF
jgi:hypothetical protein